MERPSGPVPSGPSRREMLAAGALLPVLGRVRPPEDDALDAAFERIAARFPGAGLHASNHAPMVSEVLSVLGHPEAIGAWLDRNLVGREDERGEARPIDETNWRAALGDTRRHADWHAHFTRLLAEEDWKDVLRRWAPRLVSGLAGHATHGVIRTGHGVRALARRESPARRRELATGLAYWATTWQELPWDGSLRPRASVASALAEVRLRRPALPPPPGNIVAGLTALAETPSFAPVAGLIDTRDPARTLSEMASAFARLYRQNPERTIAFTHTVTAPAALRLLVPYLDDETVEAGLRHAWKAAAGILVVYGDPKPPACGPRAVERATLAARVVRVGETHPIKLVEACLREEALSHDVALLETAEEAIESHG